MDPDRIHRAALLRLAGPGDALLGLLCRLLGAERTLALIRGVGPNPAELDLLAGEALGEEHPGLPGTGGASSGARVVEEALQRWRVRLADIDDGELRRGALLGARLAIPGDDEWPACFDDLGDGAPIALWLRGPLHLAETVQAAAAIIGARAATDLGVQQAREHAHALTEEGFAVVSGGAFGIDIAAHRQVLATAQGERAPTIAFMAGGVDRLYPRGNAGVLEEIARRGLIASESALGLSPMRHRFLLRNRLIAASTRAVLVVEAGHRSGALHTAHLAAELLRPVGAVPGSVLAPSSAGCHRLIREGAAVLIAEPAHLRELLPEPPIPIDSADDERRHDGLDQEQSRVHDALSGQASQDPSVLAQRAGLPIVRVLAALAALELRGLARQREAGWRRC